jgi:hypothetical protein
MESNNVKFPDDPSVTLTIRLIMQGKVSIVFKRLLLIFFHYIILSFMLATCSLFVCKKKSEQMDILFAS